VFLDDGENMCPIFIHLDLRLTLLLSGYFTVSVSMVLWLNEPEVPVKVRVKVPGAVAGLGRGITTASTNGTASTKYQYEHGYTRDLPPMTSPGRGNTA
jgi:hypothetical protein